MKIKDNLKFLTNQFSGLNIEENKNFRESFDYNSTPNLKYKETIVKDFKHDYWIFDNYDIYYSEIENNRSKFELFLIYGCQDKENINNIKIVRIHDKKLVKELKGHEHIVDIVKHFYNSNNKKRYLLSADYERVVIVWDLNLYTSIFTISTFYSQYIYSFLIIFEKDYIITSSEGDSSNDYLNIYSLNNGGLLLNIESSNKNKTYYLLLWKYNGIYYLIELCYKKIIIYDLLYKKVYKQFESNEDALYYYSGFVSQVNNYLHASTNKGNINIWNLESFNLIYDFRIKSSYLFKIILWSTDIIDTITNKKYNNYILVCDKRRGGFLCINITFDREINNIKEEDFNFEHKINSFYSKGTTIKCIKKIIHPIYGQCLISSGEDQNIDLWVNNNKLNFEFY